MKYLLAIITILFVINPLTALAGGQYSGFLDSYPKMEADKDRAGAKIWRKPGVSLKAYDKIMIEPILIWYANDSKYKGISPDQLKAVADAFSEGITRALEPDYPVVNTPGEGVLVIRAAVTNVYAKKKKRGLMSFTPVGFVVTTAKDAAGKRIQLDDAVIEAELLDGKTGDRLAVLVDRMSRTDGKKGTSWQAIQQTIDFYASRFRSRLDAEHQ